MQPRTAENPLDKITTLTFDLFGTVLDLTGSLVPPISRFLADNGSAVDGGEFWGQWRARQRLEQHQDTIMMLGHSGYLEVAKRAFMFTLRSNGVDFTYDEVDDFMMVWQELVPFADAVQGLNELKGHYRLVGLSNGESWLLKHLAENQIKFEFDDIISVEEAGFFKPHPSVYRTATRILQTEPGEIMMVAAHSFDIMGARACGFRGAFVNRYNLPYEESPFQPDLTVNDFVELASELKVGLGQ